jgi:hypothetical protein
MRSIKFVRSTTSLSITFITSPFQETVTVLVQSL